MNEDLELIYYNFTIVTEKYVVTVIFTGKSFFMV